MFSIERVRSDDPHFNEVVVRLVAIDQDGGLHSFGTGFVLLPNLVVTARHVIEEFIRLDPDALCGTISKFQFWAIQIVDVSTEPNYAVWDVSHVSTSGHSDIALLKLSPHNDVAGAYRYWKAFRCTLFPPKVGDLITAFGLHSTSFEGSKVDSGGLLAHLNMNDTPTRSTGKVIETFPNGRERVVMPFPCFAVEAEFRGGMSGGLVINESSEVCGLVSTGYEFAEDGGPPLAFAAMLWPIMSIQIDFSTFRSSPISGSNYLLSLAYSGHFQPKGWDRVVIKQNPSGPGCRISFLG